MPDSIPASTLEKFTTFGDLLRYLRRRAGITQVELSIAVGYSDPQISRLEQNLRLPDIPTIEARFIAPLHLEDETRAVARLLELAAAVRREDAPAPGLCPYKGLDFFDEADADLFVGREALTEKLLEGVLNLTFKEQTEHDRFFAIVGASGSGKSSLVRAGLVPALRWNKASTAWPIQILTPTAHPLESLATSLTRTIGSMAAMAKLMDDLALERRSLSLYIRSEVKTSPGSYFLLIIDQFEELFALCHSEAERSAFIDNLLTAAYDADGKVVIIITLRADFYSHCAGYLELRHALAKHQEYIGAMSDEEMRRAIEEPARRGRWEFEPGLVDLILHDVGHEPGALPLLSHALLETWQRRHGRTLTLSGYISSGGVRGAIAETAEAVFTDQFTHEQQAIARRIFLRLTELGDETSTGDTRRRATFDELILKPEENDSTLTVLKALADARLITTSEDSVQVAHEALIREWPTLRGWLEDNREGLRLHSQLSEAAQEWLASAREPDILFRGARLAQAREWADTHVDDMNVQEMDFLAASAEASEREAAEREATRQRELEAAQKLVYTQKLRAEEGISSAHRLKRRAILMGVVGAIAVLLAVFAVFAWQRSSSQAALNRSLSLAATSEKLNNAGQGDLALLLAMEAAKFEPAPPEALSALRTVASGFGTRSILNGHTQAVRAVVISPDAKTAFSGSCAQMDAEGSCSAGELVLWDLDNKQVRHQWSAHAGWITTVAFSQEWQRLVSGAEDGTLISWDINGDNPQQLSGNTAGITDLAILAGTNNLISGSVDGSMILWDLKTGNPIKRYETDPTNPITSIAYAASSDTAVSAHQDGSLMVWDLNDFQPVKRFSDQGKGIKAVAISPDGNRIIFSTAMPPDMYIRLIDGHSGELLSEKMLGCAPGDLALSLDLNYVIFTCSSALYQLDLQSWNILGSSQESLGQNVIAITQDGRLGISGSQDGILSVWNLSDQLDYQIHLIDSDVLIAVAISPDSRYLLLNDALRNGYQQPVLWDIVKRKVVRTYTGFDAATSPGAAAISPDSLYVAAAGLNMETGAPTAIIWDFNSSAPHCRFDDEFSENVRALAFSPDSKYLLVGSQVIDGMGGHLILFDIKSCDIVLRFDTTEEVSSVRFSADGTRAITGSSFLSRVILWDVATGKEIRRYSYSDNGPILTAVFGPGEATVLGSGMGELYRWDVETTTVLHRYTGIPTIPFSMAISPNGMFIMAGSMDGTVIMWDVVTGEKLHQFNVNYTVFGMVFSPDSKTAFVTSSDGKLIEWHVAVKSLPELLDWIDANRYVRELTCAEREQYHVDPLCKP